MFTIIASAHKAASVAIRTITSEQSKKVLPGAIATAQADANQEVDSGFN